MIPLMCALSTKLCKGGDLDVWASVFVCSIFMDNSRISRNRTINLLLLG
jgi:hypothetical protein